jgi:hypothetical protein
MHTYIGCCLCCRLPLIHPRVVGSIKVRSMRQRSINCRMRRVLAPKKSWQLDRGWDDRLVLQKHGSVQKEVALRGRQLRRPLSFECRMLAPLRHADEHQECPLIGVGRKGPADGQSNAIASYRKWATSKDILFYCPRRLPDIESR